MVCGMQMDEQKKCAKKNLSLKDSKLHFII
jgi:hypothetical protein